ncbi:polysaccharide pyruvyl transferase family protein [Parasynechococcus sp.]|uniref:polysaccharide pyruvyl transferase family protein n=1 Tax=Parasynechococcus sp. TaxID=3101203 RepID=UPI003704CB00
MKHEMDIQKIYASTLKPQANTGNLGDIFGYLAIERLSKQSIRRTGIPNKNDIDHQTLVLVGSILNHIRPNQNAVIYGPGFITGEDNPKRLKGNRIVGVRGKLSKKIIERAFPDSRVKVCSDPGLLMKPLIAADFKAANAVKLGAIVHSVDRAQFLKSSFNHIPIVEHYKGIDHFLKSISEYTHLISTSLHGMIFCHSLGIPVLPVAISNKITGGSFKFNDYLSSVNIKHKRQLMMLHQAPRSESKLIELIEDHPQPSQGLIEELSQKQARTIKRLLRNPPQSPSF